MTRCCEQSIAWSKQNLADSVQEAHDLQLRPVKEGRVYPAPVGTLAKARWLGAGWPDYPWLFGTDGEYTAFASVAMGQFADIKAHLRALRDISEVTNGDSGKVVHEVTPDGSIYYGTLDSRRQHRRDLEVPQRRRSDLAVDRRRRLPRRPLRLHRPQHAVRRRPA